MKYCVKCGAELCDEAVVCPKCGCMVDGSLVEKDFPGKIEEKKAEPVVAAEKRSHTWLSLVLGILAVVFTLVRLINNIGFWQEAYWRFWNNASNTLYDIGINEAIVPITVIISAVQLRSKNKVMPIIGLILGCLAFTLSIADIIFGIFFIYY